MQEVTCGKRTIEVLAYSKQEKKHKECKYRFADWCHNPKFDDQEKCPFNEVAMDRIHHCKDFEPLENEFVSLVVRRFEKCPYFKKVENESSLCSRSNNCTTEQLETGCVVNFGEIEQTFKVNKKYKFALQTGKCEDCRWFIERDICSFIPQATTRDSRCNDFEPRIISGVVREEGIPFEVIKGKALCKQYAHMEGFDNLPDGEYILLPKVEVVK